MFSQIPTSTTILNSGLIGYYGVSLTNFSTSALSNIASGSAIEIAGAFFKASGDLTIATSWTTIIPTATTAYLTLTPAGTAGSQTISAAWTSVQAVWDTAKQGWYTTTTSGIRVVASAYKNSNTSQEYKVMYDTRTPISPTWKLNQKLEYTADLTNIIAGAVLITNSAIAAYKKVKEIVIDRRGTVGCTFELKTETNGATAYGCIYVNSVASVFECTNSTTDFITKVVTSISVLDGDCIQLWMHAKTSGYAVNVRNFIVYGHDSSVLVTMDNGWGES